MTFYNGNIDVMPNIPCEDPLIFKNPGVGGGGGGCGKAFSPLQSPGKVQFITDV